MKFDWNKKKAESNFKKYGISFDEAKTVFDDLFYVDLYDPAHSESEHRFLIVGQSKQGRLLIVSYVERDEKARIISARELTPKERRDYEQGRFE